MDTSFSIVHFFEDESVEAVPSFWYKNKYCACPKNRILIGKFIVSNRVPNDKKFRNFNARQIQKGIGKLKL